MASRRKLRHEDNPEAEVMREAEHVPQTPLGRRLWQIRQRIVESGGPLLDWDGIEREVAERRGGAFGQGKKPGAPGSTPPVRRDN